MEEQITFPPKDFPLELDRTYDLAGYYADGQWTIYGHGKLVYDKGKLIKNKAD